MRLPPVTVKSMSNLTFDWSGRHEGLPRPPDQHQQQSGHRLVAGLLELPLAELETKLNADTLSQQDVSIVPPPSWPAPGMTTGGMTSAQLYNFTVNGAEITPAQFDDVLEPGDVPAHHVHVHGRGGERHGDRRGVPDAADVPRRPRRVVHDGGAEERLHAADLPGQPAEPDDHRRHGRDAGAHARAGRTWSTRARRTRSAACSRTTTSPARSSATSRETPEQLEKKFLDLDMIATKYYRADIATDGIARLHDAEGRHRRQLHRRRRQRHLDGGSHLRQLPQPRALVHDDPQALHAVARGTVRRAGDSATVQLRPVALASSEIRSQHRG